MLEADSHAAARPLFLVWELSVKRESKRNNSSPSELLRLNG